MVGGVTVVSSDWDGIAPVGSRMRCRVLLCMGTATRREA